MATETPPPQPESGHVHAAIPFLLGTFTFALCRSPGAPLFTPCRSPGALAYDLEQILR